MVGLMATPSKRAYYNQVCCTQSPCPCGRPLLTHTSTGDTQTLKGRSGLVSVGSPGTQKILSESSKHLWQVWGLILNAISCLLPSCWGFSSALGPGVSFNGGIQHSPVNDCSAAGCNFGVLVREDVCTSFYSAILARTSYNRTRLCFPQSQALPSGSFHKPLNVIAQRTD